MHPRGRHRQLLEGQPKARVLDGLSPDIVLPSELSPLAFTRGNPQSSLKNLLCGELSFSGGHVESHENGQ